MQLLLEGNAALGRKCCCQHLLGSAEPPPICRETWSKASQAGWEKTESRKGIHFSLGNKSSLDFWQSWCSSVSPGSSTWGEILAELSVTDPLQLQMPPEITAGIPCRQISTGKRGWLCQTRLSLPDSPWWAARSDRSSSVFLPQDSSQFWSRSKLSWHQNVVT